jgi:peroxiredoxin
LMITVGDKFPNSSFKVMGVKGPEDISSDDLFGGKRIVLFALPGAFTPTCHLNHLPGYLENLEVLKSKGIDDVYVVSVNDVWVMNAWAKETNARGRIGFLADGSCEVTKALGMEVDAGPAGMGMRSQRYSMLLEDGVVKTVNIETKRGQAVVSGASTMLEQI